MRRRILLADDSVTIQKVIELTFMDEDYEVRAVSNGDEAIQVLPEVDPDVVIADVHMPGANGYEVCRRAKAMKPEIPVLLLVGTFEPFDESQARAAGANSFLKKPFDSQELLQRVGDLMAAAPAAPAAPSVGAETVRLSALSSMPAMSFEPEPAAQPVEEWKGFELSPEPELSSPFNLGATDSSFSLEEPAAEPMFEMEEEPASAPAYSPGGDVFGYEPQPIAAAPSYDALSPVEDFSDTERLGVPEAAAPLVGSLEETERRIESPAPLGLEQSHEPPSAPRMAVPPMPEAIPVSAPLATGRVEVANTADGRLSDADVDRIARRVVELLGDRAIRDVAWEVIPDLAEVVIRDRLRELESQAESLE
ncbi:MAG TPA: response regulator [Thermoanaerobaculia bacterium]|jgi:CheY-like chemotaxis protein|nr:response regulator [Thermoanaerobaculia bacterium]